MTIFEIFIAFGSLFYLGLALACFATGRFLELGVLILLAWGADRWLA